MLGNTLGALVTLFGFFGVGAVVCAIVWSLFAWSGRWYDWLLSFVTPLGLASITTFMAWLVRRQQILLQKSPKREARCALAPRPEPQPATHSVRAVAGDYFNDCQRDFGVT